MRYTVRLAHLSKINVKVGDKVTFGTLLGVMGNTGASTGSHLHIGCIKGTWKNDWRLSHMVAGKPKPAPIILGKFINGYLFMSELAITTYYYDPYYPMQQNGKQHPAYDVIPADKKSFNIHWPIDNIEGEVISVNNDRGYGKNIHISFDC